MAGMTVTVYNPYSLERFQRRIPFLDQGVDYHDDVRAQPAREWLHGHAIRKEERSFDMI